MKEAPSGHWLLPVNRFAAASSQKSVKKSGMILNTEAADWENSNEHVNAEVTPETRYDKYVRGRPGTCTANGTIGTQPPPPPAAMRTLDPPLSPTEEMDSFVAGSSSMEDVARE